MRNLQAEMLRRDVSIEQVAAAMQTSVSTVYNKIGRKTPLHLDEAIAVRDQLFPDLTIEYLFEDGGGAG